MVELFLGFALGAMAFTEQGRSLGNKIGNAAIAQIKTVMSDGKKSAEQSPGAAGDDRNSG